MAAVGGVTCDYVSGGRGGLKTRGEVWDVPGVDGFGARTLGQGKSSFRYTLKRIAAEASVLTWGASIEALQMTVVSITDDWGDAVSNCLITAVSPLVKSAEIPNGCIGVMVIEGVILP